MLIDTHCHIYLPEFDQDRVEMIDRARKSGVEEFYMPGIDSSTHKGMLDVEEEFKKALSKNLRPKFVIDESIDQHAIMCVENSEDLNELQGAALLARELGAKVIGEYPSK